MSLKVEVFYFDFDFFCFWFWQEYSSKSLEVCTTVVHVLLYVEFVCFLRKCLMEKRKRSGNEEL